LHSSITCIDLLDRFGELVPHIDESLRSHNLTTSSEDQQYCQNIVRIPDQIDQVLTARATDASQPVFDRPLPRTSPFPDDFDGLMGGAQFAFQSISDGPWVRFRILAVWKNYALFRQHSAGPPQLWWFAAELGR
jgi:hypothetical protein